MGLARNDNFDGDVERGTGLRRGVPGSRPGGHTVYCLIESGPERLFKGGFTWLTALASPSMLFSVRHDISVIRSHGYLGYVRLHHELDEAEFIFGSTTLGDA